MYQQQVHLTHIYYYWILGKVHLWKYWALVHLPVTVSKFETTQKNRHCCYILRPVLKSYIFWHVSAIWGSACSTCETDQLWEYYDNYFFGPLQNTQFLPQSSSKPITGTSFMHCWCYGKVNKLHLMKNVSSASLVNRFLIM